MCQAPRRVRDDHASRGPVRWTHADRSSLPVPSDGPWPEPPVIPPEEVRFPAKSGAEGALVEELGRLHWPPKLLASFIRQTAIPIRLRTESGTLRRLSISAQRASVCRTHGTSLIRNPLL
jgi:hypothetical protein